MLKISGLCKSFGKTEALYNVNLDLDRKAYGLLGLNGAGKTTLFRCVTGLLKSDKGTIIKPEKTSYLPQAFQAYGFLTVREMLEHFAFIRQVPDGERKEAAEEAAEYVNLQDQLSKRCSALSGGMMRRLGIAQAILGSPELILFDEPTAGLDPQERARFSALIEQLKKKNITVILSTHIVGDVEEGFDEILVMHKGKMIARGPAESIAAEASGLVYRISQQNMNDLKEPFLVLNSQYREGKETVRVMSEEKQEAELSEPTLEDGFITLITRNK